jgi:hypothetical protein
VDTRRGAGCQLWLTLPRSRNRLFERCGHVGVFGHHVRRLRHVRLASQPRAYCFAVSHGESSFAPDRHSFTGPAMRRRHGNTEVTSDGSPAFEGAFRDNRLFPLRRLLFGRLRLHGFVIARALPTGFHGSQCQGSARSVPTDFRTPPPILQLGLQRSCTIQPRGWPSDPSVSRLPDFPIFPDQYHPRLSAVRFCFPIPAMTRDVERFRRFGALPPPRVIPDWRALAGVDPRPSQIGAGFSNWLRFGVQLGRYWFCF